MKNAVKERKKTKQGIKIILVAAAFIVCFFLAVFLLITHNWKDPIKTFDNTNPYITEYGKTMVSAHRSGGGMVDIEFEIGDEFLMKVPAKIIDIDYHITFGTLSGFVCDPDGNKYVLDGMAGIGEDKSLVF